MKVMDQLIPLMLKHMNEWNAKVSELGRISCLAMLGREEEAKAKAYELREYFVKLSGENCQQVPYIDRLLKKIDNGEFHMDNVPKQV